jgi:hypothetical protein
MKVCVNISKTTAVKAGKNKYGYQVAEVDVGALPQEVRDYLAGPLCASGWNECPKADLYVLAKAGQFPPHGEPECRAVFEGLVEATPEAVAKLVADLMAAEAAVTARKAREAAEDAENRIQMAVQGGVDKFLEKSYPAGGARWAVRLPYGLDKAADDGRVAEMVRLAELEAERRNAECDRLVAAEAEAATAKKAAEEARKEAARDEMLAWVGANGSGRLKRCLAEGIDCEAAYRDERLSKERPGWTWYQTTEGDYDDPRNPPLEAFALLDEARKTDPAARLVYWVVENDDSGDDDGSEAAKYLWRGYAAVADFLDREIVYGVPEAVTAG